MLYIIILLLFILFLAVFVFVYKALPIINGYGAKILCSNVFVCGRNPEDVIKNELGSFPLNAAKYEVDMQKKAVTASVAGRAKKKAIYREGLGATLINGISEPELRRQSFTTATPPDIDQDIVEWPMGNLIKNKLPHNINKEQLDIAINEAFSEPKGHVRRTRALIIVHNGEIVAEQYAENFSVGSKFSGWSVAKSVTNALIGILVKQNRLNVDAPAAIEEWKGDSRNGITITHLIQMCSGLSWWEYYKAPSDVTNMLYNEANMGEFATRKKLRRKPGKKVNYSSGSTNILSYIIRKIIGDRTYYRFPYEELFYKTGMLNTIMEVDVAGTFVGSSYCYATARDWARFGLLYLNDGVFNGERILPEGWVKFTATPTRAKTTKDEGKYGALWWLNKGDGDNALNRKYPNVPEDCIRCQGHEGQYMLYRQKNW